MQILQRVSLISHRFVVSRDLIFSGFIEAKRCFLQNHVFGTKREKSFKKTSELLPKPPQIRPETLKSCLKTSLKRNSRKSCERSEEKYEKLHFEAMEPWLELSGLGPQKLSPWGFKGLGLLDLLLVALIIKVTSAT